MKAQRKLALPATANQLPPSRNQLPICPRQPIRILFSLQRFPADLPDGGRKGWGFLRQPRCFQRAPRSAKEYYEKAENVRLNPVKAGLVKHVGDWPPARAHDYSESLGRAVSANRAPAVDWMLLPAGE
jgi:hypothetical protein